MDQYPSKYRTTWEGSLGSNSFGFCINIYHLKPKAMFSGINYYEEENIKNKNKKSNQNKP